jgi:hypothetical protein
VRRRSFYVVRFSSIYFFSFLKVDIYAGETLSNWD